MTITTKVDTIIDGLKNRILSGEFNEGKLPSFRKLVTEYETSQETMNKAIQTLQAEGYLISSGAKGVFVRESRIRIPGTVVDFSEYLKNIGDKPTSEFVGKPEIIVPSLEIAKQMKLKKDQKVLRRERQQGTDRAMYRLIESYFPMHLLNEDILKNIDKDPHFNIINAIKNQSGRTIQFSHEEIIARLPTVYEQEHLKIVRNNPVIEAQIVRLTEDKKTIVCYTRKVLNANLFLLSFDYTVEHWK